MAVLFAFGLRCEFTRVYEKRYGEDVTKTVKFYLKEQMSVFPFVSLFNEKHSEEQFLHPKILIHLSMLSDQIGISTINLVTNTPDIMNFVMLLPFTMSDKLCSSFLRYVVWQILGPAF